jgi:predicted enzyme related to lactoylglutathione lyase
MAGELTWFDLSSGDNAASIRFYTQLMGWTTESWGGDAYTMFKSAEGKTFGGIMPLTDEAKKMGAPPNWMGYVSVDDVDQAVAKATQLGGKVYVPGTDIPNTGRFAVLADPAGAVIAVFKRSNPAGEPNQAVAWSEISTTDPDKSWAWLAGMFGWKKADSMEMPGGGVYQMIKGDGDAFAGMSKAPPEMPMSAWAYYFACDDCRALFAKAKEMGSTELYAPMQVPGGGWAALLVDPQGAAFGLFSMA